MAIFTPGPTVAAVSGSVGGTTFSRNRGGAYMRNRAIPVTSSSEKALRYRSYLAGISQAWRALDADIRQAWRIYAQTNPVVNRLGQSKALTGQNHFIRLNTRLMAAGDDGITAPPVAAPPTGILVEGFTVDAGAGDTELDFTETPLAANQRLWIRGAKVNSAAIVNVNNLLTEVLISNQAAAAPLDLESALEAAFGPLQEGAQYVLEIRVLDSNTGLVSNRVFARTVAVSTT